MTLIAAPANHCCLKGLTKYNQFWHFFKTQKSHRSKQNQVWNLAENRKAAIVNNAFLNNLNVCQLFSGWEISNLAANKQTFCMLNSFNIHLCKQSKTMDYYILLIIHLTKCHLFFYPLISTTCPSTCEMIKLFDTFVIVMSKRMLPLLLNKITYNEKHINHDRLLHTSWLAYMSKRHNLLKLITVWNT